MSSAHVISILSNGRQEIWRPTTLDRLSKDEKFLQDTIAAAPDLLGIQSRRTGIHGPFRTFTEIPLNTSTKQTIFADVVIFAASGHVIAVEVKLSTNPELRSRDVIAQIVDYATWFTTRTESDLLRLFGKGLAPCETWEALVSQLFPDQPRTDELAAALWQRMQLGEVNLAIACDRVPPKLLPLVAGVSAQSALAFELDLVEIVPYVRDGSIDDIALVPTTRLATEIVGKTAITVTYRQGESKPSTQIQTVSLQEVEQQVAEVRQSANPLARLWTPDEVEAEFASDGNQAQLELLKFAKEQSADGQFVSPQVKRNPTFGLVLKGRREGGDAARLMLFYSVLGHRSINLYFSAVEALAGTDVAAEFRRRLKAIVGDGIKADGRELGIPMSTLEKRLPEFKELVLWLMTQVEKVSLDRTR